MPFPTLPTWFAKKRSAAPETKDRSHLRVGIPKILNIWTTHQFWVGFLKALGVASENIVFSSDTSEEQGREFGKGRGTVETFSSLLLFLHEPPFQSVDLA